MNHQGSLKKSRSNVDQTYEAVRGNLMVGSFYGPASGDPSMERCRLIDWVGFGKSDWLDIKEGQISTP